MNACVSWAISGVALRPVPMAHTGSYARVTWSTCDAVWPARPPSICARRRPPLSPPSRSASLSPMQRTGSRPPPRAARRVGAREPARERRGQLARDRLVGLAEERAPLGMAEQDARGARVDQHPAGDLARE